MIKDAETFKQADKDFTNKHEAKQELESYISTVESTSASLSLPLPFELQLTTPRSHLARRRNEDQAPEQGRCRG